MGQIVKKKPKTEYDTEIDWKLLTKVAFSTLGFIVVAALALALTFHTVRWVTRTPPPPPKIVYKYQSAYSQAQTDFVRACKDSVRDAPHTGYNNNGVPDVHSSNWTCTFPQ